MKVVSESVVLASRLLRDGPTDSVSLIDCLDTVWAPLFPWVHQSFAVGAWFRLDGDAPTDDTPISFRIVRVDDVDSERTISAIDGVWKAGTRRARVATSFQVLNLVRPGRLGFRVDFKLGAAPWQHGSTATLDVCEAGMSDEERSALAAVIAQMSQAAQGVAPD